MSTTDTTTPWFASACEKHQYKGYDCPQCKSEKEQAQIERIAIAFAEWVNLHDGQEVPEGWVIRDTQYEKFYTMSQLFQLFITQPPKQ